MSDDTGKVAAELAEAIARIQKELNDSLREIWAKHFALYPDKLRMLDPLYDIEDRGDSLAVYVDLPGFRKNEIKIRVTEDSLEVFAEKSEERVKDEDSRKYIQRQRLYKQVYKKISLPVKVRPEQARARFEDGVLVVLVPKSGAEKEVEVKVE
ncbi:Hsp20/alpha crystallin family protein [Thermofilum pendens]|uniref:Heat shock protein Hsp20 n=1 Tax=Thermofilum pendens (strain DSM 2475 / Hrk 5) TaxID=368408 RepID=A1RXI1_THEPD|nr:Hsp20/alpha crystallin family protein [Thermofilum pendens]ABL77911.1 heat shock protein Hsp20 [Thermofilum pendens Hrk 5]